MARTSKGITKRIVAILLFLPALTVWAGGDSEPEQPATPGDKELKEAVVDQLFWDDRVDAASITVSVDDGRVTLEGQVDSYQVRDAAVDTAWSVTGVDWVNDQLQITETGTGEENVFLKVNVETALDLNEDIKVGNLTVQTNGDGTVTLSGAVDSYWKKVRAEEIASGVKGVSVVVNNIQVSENESVSDRMIRADIVDSLERNSDVRRDNVNVTVEQGRVTLSGTVDSWLAYTQAEEAARFTVGVEDVRNNLEIEPPRGVEVDGEEIRRDVRNQLDWDYRVDEQDVNVRVSDGVVTLRGTVETYSGKEAAEADAWSVTGVVDVRNNIEVDAETQDQGQGNISRSAENVLEWNSEIDAADIVVSTVGGIVTLEGTVDSYWKKVRAEELVANVTGVVDVQNRLAVVPGEDIVDQHIAEDIVDAIERKSFVDMEDVTVRVKDGVVTLNGQVDSRTERQAVYESALYTDGVTAVNDENLVIEPSS
jgi:osmotically-inducible protein OsmY